MHRKIIFFLIFLIHFIYLQSCQTLTTNENNFNKYFIKAKKKRKKDFYENRLFYLKKLIVCPQNILNLIYI